MKKNRIPIMRQDKVFGGLIILYTILNCALLAFCWYIPSWSIESKWGLVAFATCSLIFCILQLRELYSFYALGDRPIKIGSLKWIPFDTDISLLDKPESIDSDGIRINFDALTSAANKEGLQLPTKEEYEHLLAQTTHSWVEAKQYSQMVFTDIKNPKKNIRLTAHGNYTNGELFNNGTHGFYWSSTINGDNAWVLCFDKENGAYLQAYNRHDNKFGYPPFLLKNQNETKHTQPNRVEAVKAVIEDINANPLLLTKEEIDFMRSLYQATKQTAGIVNVNNRKKHRINRVLFPQKKR